MWEEWDTHCRGNSHGGSDCLRCRAGRLARGRRAAGLFLSGAFFEREACTDDLSTLRELFLAGSSTSELDVREGLLEDEETSSVLGDGRWETS